MSPTTDRNRQSQLEGQRAYGAVRALLITIGVCASGWLFLPPGQETVMDPAGGLIPARWLVPAGVVLQLLMIAARALIRRVAPDPVAAGQGYLVIEIIGDGVTVLLFALGTFGSYIALFDKL